MRLGAEAALTVLEGGEELPPTVVCLEGNLVVKKSLMENVAKVMSTIIKISAICKLDCDNYFFFYSVSVFWCNNETGLSILLSVLIFTRQAICEPPGFSEIQNCTFDIS